MLPVNKVTESITLPPGSTLCGIRFHPACAFAVFGTHFTHPLHISPDELETSNLHELFDTLRRQAGNAHHIEILRRWADEHIESAGLIPESIEQAFAWIDREEKPGSLEQHIGLSQRQIERLFDKWLGMTPKHFQRVLRVRNTIQFLKQNSQADLADVAIRFGFSDQAHMTREFRSIANTTPGSIRDTEATKRNA